MFTLVNVVALIICVLLCYLVCGIPFGLIVGKHSKAGVDVRTVGSGNIGMTNVARSAGKFAAALTLLLDAGKGFAALMLARFIFCAWTLGGDVALTAAAASFGWVSSLFYAACVLGHVFSIYLGFKGGKGISVGLGAGLAWCAPAALIMLAVFMIFALPSKYVSLGSVAAAISLPFAALVCGIKGAALLPLVVVSVVVIWAHRKNVRALINHTERQFTIKK